jgi:hypothetical protein
VREIRGGGGKKVGCGKGRWCEQHWCGQCKKARDCQEGAQGFMGLSHGVAGPARQKQGQKPGEEQEVELKERFREIAA